MPHGVNVIHNKHYAKWMGNAPIMMPHNHSAKDMFLKLGVVIGIQTYAYYHIAKWADARTVAVSPTRPEWHSSFVSDLEFNPPLWRNEMPGSIPYVRTVSIEDTWERVKKIKGDHWTDKYEYTKPWEVDDGQFTENRARYW